MAAASQISSEAMLASCQELLDVDGRRPRRTLAEYLAAIGKLDSLSAVGKGDAVLVRGDVDAKVGAEIGQGDIRLRSMLDTLKFGRERGWKQVIFGHIGRKPEETLAKVAKRLGQLLGCDVPLVGDWLDESTMTILPEAAAAVAGSAPGSILVLENTRRYNIERVLWKAKPADLAGWSQPLSRLANEFAQKIARNYVHEALSAGSLDASSVIVPAAMHRVALGHYEESEFSGPMMRCLEAQLVVFSGLKIDKLDDMEAMIGRGTIRMLFAAGSLAMALLKADAKLAGRDFSLGIAEDPGHADKPYYIPPERIEQAQRMLNEGRKKGIEFVLPIDFVLADGTVSTTIGPGQQQLDVGPKSSELFAEKVGQFIAANQGKQAVAFHNGVFGMFEDPRFAEGTRRFVAQLRRLKDAGVLVYVGGGEGGAALEQYGSLSDVTHCFTAGGTVLNALGSEPVPYLIALSMAASRKRG